MSHNKFKSNAAYRVKSFLSASLAMLALTASASAETVKIGLLVQLTGASSADGQEIVKGAQLAIKEINETGGINGNTFELVIGDTRDGASSDVTAQVQRILGDEDVHFMLAGYASLTGFEIDLMAEAEMPYMIAGPSAQTSAIIAPKPDDYWCCWSLTPSYAAYNTDVTRLADKLAKDGKLTLGSPKKLALVSSDNPYSSTIYAGMKAEAAATNWSLTVDQVVPFGEVNDWRTVLSQVRSDVPDLVVNLDYLPANSASFLNQFMENPTNSLMFLQYAPSVPEFVQLTGQKSTGVLYDLLGGGIANSKNPRGLEVSEKFKKAYNAESGVYGIAVYEMLNVYFDALRKVKDPTDHKAIGEAIGATDKAVAQGRLAFDPATHLAKDGDDYIPIQFYQIWDGERVLISPEKYATGEFRMPPWIKK